MLEVLQLVSDMAETGEQAAWLPGPGLSHSRTGLLETSSLLDSEHSPAVLPAHLMLIPQTVYVLRRSHHAALRDRLPDDIGASTHLNPRWSCILERHTFPRVIHIDVMPGL